MKAFRLADNPLGELSSWDKRALALELKELAAVELDANIVDLTAFETAEIDLHIESLDDGAGVDKADLLPKPGTGSAVTRPGDLWKLGPHRLICATSLEPETYVALLGGELVQAVWSDPPFNVRITGHVCGSGKVQHREFAMASGEMNEEEFTDLLARYLPLARQHSQPGSLRYVCMAARTPSSC